MKITAPRLLVAALVLNLALAITASPIYVGPKNPALHVGTTKGSVNPFFKPKLSAEMNAWKDTNLNPPPCDGCPEEHIYLCVCPLVFCELWMYCYEVI